MKTVAFAQGVRVGLLAALLHFEAAQAPEAVMLPSLELAAFCGAFANKEAARFRPRQLSNSPPSAKRSAELAGSLQPLAGNFSGVRPMSYRNVIKKCVFGAS